MPRYWAIRTRNDTSLGAIESENQVRPTHFGRTQLPRTSTSLRASKMGSWSQRLGIEDIARECCEGGVLGEVLGEQLVVVCFHDDLVVDDRRDARRGSECP